MRLILDATPLIHLTKAGFSFEKLEAELITTSEVLEEVLTEEFPENARIKDMLNSKKLSIENPKSALEETSIHKGEFSVISLAKETNSICVIDDKTARTYAKSLKVKTIYSASIIVDAQKKRLLSKEEAISIINKMISTGWRCDVESYKQILAKIESL